MKFTIDNRNNEEYENSDDGNRYDPVGSHPVKH